MDNRKKKKINIYFILVFVFLAVSVFTGIKLLTAYIEKNEDEKNADSYVDYLVENASEIDRINGKLAAAESSTAPKETDTSSVKDTENDSHSASENNTEGKTEKDNNTEDRTENNDTADINTAPAKESVSAVYESSTSYIDDNGVKHVVRNPYSPITDTSTYYYKDGVLWLPSYAAGSLFGVLEIPSISLSRGVYTGTAEEITANYTHYLANIGHPAMNLTNEHNFGTQITIQGHNTTDQDLSFNRLGYVNIGEKFYIICDQGVYVYTIADIYMMSRPLVEKALINYYNTFDSDYCFLTTCGRDYLPLSKCVYYSSPRTMEENTDGFSSAADLKTENYAQPVSSRYLDIVVEGHLEKIMNLTEYAASRLEEEENWRR